MKYVFIVLLILFFAQVFGQSSDRKESEVLDLASWLEQDSVGRVYLVNLSGCQEIFREEFKKKEPKGPSISSSRRFDSYYNYGTGTIQTIVGGGERGSWLGNVGSCYGWSMEGMAAGSNRMNNTLWRGLHRGDLWAYLCVEDSVSLDSCICDRYLSDEIVYWSALQLQKKFKRIFFGVVLQEDLEKLPSSVREKNVAEFLLEKYGADLIIGLRQSSVHLQVRSANAARGKMAKINLTGHMEGTYQCLWNICSTTRKKSVSGNYSRYYTWNNVRYQIKMSQIVPPLRMMFEELGKEAGENFAGRIN